MYVYIAIRRHPLAVDADAFLEQARQRSAAYALSREDLVAMFLALGLDTEVQPAEDEAAAEAAGVDGGDEDGVVADEASSVNPPPAPAFTDHAGALTK